MLTQPEELLLELLRATALGDQIAFAELYRITSGKLYAIASRMLRRADTASDALQEAYVRIWTQSGDYDVDKGQPIHWMAAIVRHVCIDMLRRTASPTSAQSRPSGDRGSRSTSRYRVGRCRPVLETPRRDAVQGNLNGVLLRAITC